MRINNNISALNTLNQMNVNNNNVSRNMERLSSGLRINRAADDAAGLSISEKMRGQIRGLEQASSNAQDGVSLIQTAEGALNEVHAMLQRQRELAVQGANDTNAAEDRTAIENELSQLTEEITRILDETTFNGIELFTADAEDLTLQVGANNGSGQTITIELEDFARDDVMVTIDSDLDHDDFQSLIQELDTAIAAVSQQRSSFGAVQNRLEHTINNLNTSSENLTAAESRIRDTDMAREMMEMTQNNVLQQAAQAMLAQANQQPQSVLQLLR